MTQSTLTSKYQTTVPKEIRQELGLQPQDVLGWEVVGREARVVPAQRGFLNRRGSIKLGPGSTVDDVLKARAMRPRPRFLLEIVGRLAPRVSRKL